MVEIKSLSLGNFENMNDPTNNYCFYPFGVLFFRFSDLQGLSVNRYFNCLRAVKPLLLENPDFKDSMSGFYINYITNRDDDYGNSVRLTYFTNNETKTRKAIQSFLFSSTSNDVRLFCSKDCKVNIVGNAASGNAEEELRFRIFSNIYTHIGLDLLDEKVLANFRSCLAEYMLELAKLLNTSGFSTEEKEIDAKSFFNSFFEEHSIFFKNELDDSKREQLWKDLRYCPRKELDFPHFLANMFAVQDNGRLMS